MSGNDNTSFTTRSVTLATTLTANDFVLICTASSAYAVTLPTADLIQPGRSYVVIKDAGAFAVTITATGGDTINGAATEVLAASAFHAVTLFSDGLNWFVSTRY
jgi:hypothetical protein